jgi:hypothetical protein
MRQFGLSPLIFTERNVEELKQYYNCHNTCHKQQATCNLTENPIKTAIQLATNCCQSSAILADWWQPWHAHLLDCVRAQKYSNEQSVAAIHRCASTAMNIDTSIAVTKL